MSLLSPVELAPADPILGLTEKFNADTRTKKANLGVGVYQDDTGRLPLLRCIKVAEQRLAEHPKPRGYLPIDGLGSYVADVKALVFGNTSPLLAGERVVTVQALGGTGGLKVGADFLKRVAPAAQVLISAPSWENHLALFTRAGFQVGSYSYYDAERREVDFEAMLADLESAAPGTIVVLHACCHNPTGYDLDATQWERIIDAVAQRELMPFIDLAYQGFAVGLEPDAWVVRRFAERIPSFFVATSFSKSFGLYGERVGALSIVCDDADQANRVRSQVKIVIRTNYSNPPTHGAQLVATVLADAELRSVWEEELSGMRLRIQQVRGQLVEYLRAAGVDDMGFIAEQRGMFSYSGLTKDQMVRLREEFAVYGTDAGRICVAAVNSGSVEYVANAIAAVR